MGRTSLAGARKGGKRGNNLSSTPLPPPPPPSSRFRRRKVITQISSPAYDWIKHITGFNIPRLKLEHIQRCFPKAVRSSLSSIPGIFEHFCITNHFAVERGRGITVQIIQQRCWKTLLLSALLMTYLLLCGFKPQMCVFSAIKR